MTYGPMASWDYYLSNYDSAGKLRVKPSVTTFSTKLTDTKKLTDKAYYTEPAVSGENVKIKFNYTSEADKAWFDSIAAEGALELVFDNNNQYLANGNLRYERTFEEHHGKTVAVLSIPTTDQGNLTTGFYRVRIKPAGSVPIMVRIKVVNNFMPKFKIKNTIVKSGDNVYFDVKNYLGSGIEEPVEKAELVLPTGEVKELKFIDNYYMYSGLFALYNDVNRKGKEEGTSGENNTIYKGEYTLRVHFKHYNTLEKTFKVVTGKEVNTETTANNNKVTVFSNKASLLKMNGMKFDAIAGASKVSTASGGSGVGSGSNPVSANVIFNIDLLANAHIITALGIDNVYAKGIVERFNERTNIIGVYDSGDLEFFEWIDYNDRVKEEEAKGRYLTFAEYRKLSDVEKINAPSRVKEVLEDNLLGELIENGSYLGKKIEGIDGATGNVVAENEWITVGGDPEYLSKIYAIYPSKEIRDKYDYGSRNRDFAISEKKYEIKGDTLKILGSAFFNPTDYYKPYNKVLQVIAVAKDGNKKYEDLVIEATIIKPKAVSLINETGNEIKKDGVVVLTGDENYISEISEIKAGGNVLEVGTDYVIEGNKLTINGSGFLKAVTKYNSSNELKVVISALGYEDYEVKVKISNLYGEATRLEKDEVTGNWRLYFNTEQEFTKYNNASMRIYGNKGSNFIENKDFTWNKEESFIEFHNLNNFTDGANNISFAPRGYRNINCTINKSDETLTLES
ncbi:MAG: hemoblobin-interacting domain-containing protein [Catonella sp.]